MPLEGERLIIEPRFENATKLADIGAPPRETPDYVERNRFWSTRRRSDVVIFERDGKIGWGLVLGMHHFEKDLRTLGCSLAWGLEQEERALVTLSGLVSDYQLKCYLLTGMFLESSKRSRVMYAFRRLRPTVALSMRGPEVNILCALCLHPIAFYEDSFAGAMTPTDDVIAHLMLMRGDEAMLWRRSNQHRAHRPEAGL